MATTGWRGERGKVKTAPEVHDRGARLDQASMTVTTLRASLRNLEDSVWHVLKLQAPMIRPSARLGSRNIMNAT